jgi:hypothetical protein
MELSIEKIVEEVIQVCKEHAEDGCFDHEGAEANALRIVKAMVSESPLESKEVKTLQECKDEVAKNNGFDTWANYQTFWKATKATSSKIEAAYDQVSNLFASQFKTPPVQEDQDELWNDLLYWIGYTYWEGFERSLENAKSKYTIIPKNKS